MRTWRSSEPSLRIWKVTWKRMQRWLDFCATAVIHALRSLQKASSLHWQAPCRGSTVYGWRLWDSVRLSLIVTLSAILPLRGNFACTTR